MSNVDELEIKKFEALAARWWDPTSEFKPLHEINPLRMGFLTSKTTLAGKRVLDIGCGGGILAEAMARQGAAVVAIDMAEASLAVARLHQLESKLDIDYRRIPAEELAQAEPEQYDIVTCLEMLEHVPDPSAIVAACYALVKPGGQVLFSTINRNPKSYLFAVIGVEYVLRMLPKGTHEYSKFIRPSELGQWIREAGLDIDQMTGLLYNPITKTYKLDKRDVDVNYMICARKPA